MVLEARSIRWKVRALSCVVLLFAACTGPLDPGPRDEIAGDFQDPGTPDDDDDEGDAVSTTQQAIECTAAQDHGWNLFENSFAATLGCPIAPGFMRTGFTVWHTGAGGCNAVNWASSVDTDGQVNVIINNSGGFLTGTCHLTVTQAPKVCAHNKCTLGGSLFAVCDSCVAQVCAVDPFCCNNSWDSACVRRVRSVCNSLACPTSPCPHAECTAGVAMPSSCSPSVSLICGRDPYCCTTAWDGQCVAEVVTIAGKNCQ